MKFTLFSLFICFAFNIHSEVDDRLSIDLSVSPSTIHLGESLYLDLHVDYPASFQINLAEIKQNLLLNSNPIRPLWKVIQITQIDKNFVHIELKPMMEGTIKGSLLAVNFFQKGDSKPAKTLYPPSFEVSVLPPLWTLESVQREAAPLLPINSPVPINLTLANRQIILNDPLKLKALAAQNIFILRERSFPWLPILILLAIIALIYGCKRWGRVFIEKFYPTVILTPKEKATNEIFRLQADFLEKKCDEKRLLVRSSHILREFLQNEFNIPASTLTREELIENKVFQALHSKELFIHFLNQIEEFKYSHQKPTREYGEAVLQNLQQIIL